MIILLKYFHRFLFDVMDSNKHTLQLACRLPLYKSSAQYLPFHYLFPVDQIKQGTDALQGSFHSWIFQCGDGWMIIFRNVLTICSCHTIILRYSFAAVNNCLIFLQNQALPFDIPQGSMPDVQTQRYSVGV